MVIHVTKREGIGGTAHISSFTLTSQNPGTEVTGERRDYEFDPIGNRESHTDGGGTPVSYDPNALNQYDTVDSVSHTFDDDGNLEQVGSGGSAVAYEWDGDEARQRGDGAPNACPKGCLYRVPSGRERQQNRLTYADGSPDVFNNPRWVEHAYDYQGRRVETKAYVEINGSPTLADHKKYIWNGWTQRGSAKMDSAQPEPEGRSAAGCPLGGKQVNLLLVVDENDDSLQTYTWGLDIAEQANGLAAGALPGELAGGVGGLLGVEEVSATQSEDHLFFYDGNGNVTQAYKWASLNLSAHYDGAQARVDGQILRFALRANHSGCPMGGMVRQYDPFGNIVNSSGSYADENRFRFSTKYLDHQTDLYYYGYRYYAPELGRWLNRDPIGEQGGLNLYGSVGNDPKKGKRCHRS